MKLTLRFLVTGDVLKSPFLTYNLTTFSSKWAFLKKVRLVGEFEIFSQEKFFPSKVRLVGQFF